MQTLGLSDSTPSTENRLKSLFWPSIRTGSDVDYLGTQGFWMCMVVALLSLIFYAISGQMLVGVLNFLFFYLGGVGVRQRSRYAATVVATMYLTGTLFIGPGLLSPGGVLRLFISALLLSNLRATWIASRWKPESEDAILPPRLDETWRDKLVDQWPIWLWPRTQVLYYIFSAGFLLLVANGLLQMFLRRVAYSDVIRFRPRKSIDASQPSRCGQHRFLSLVE